MPRSSLHLSCLSLYFYLGRQSMLKFLLLIYFENGVLYVLKIL